MSVCVCVYVYLSVCVHVRVCVCVCSFASVSVCAYLYLCVYVYLLKSVQIANPIPLVSSHDWEKALLNGGYEFLTSSSSSCEELEVIKMFLHTLRQYVSPPIEKLVSR